MSKDINILALVKGEERYIFLYTDRTRNETLRMFGRYASNAELSFSWYDAAVMSQSLRKRQDDAQPVTAPSRFDASTFEDLYLD